MKILIRALGIIIVCLLVSACFLYLLNTNVIINELNECSSLSMNQVQEYMESIIKDRLDNKTVNFSDDDYKSLYINYFNNAVQDGNKYTVNVDADSNKGIIYTNIKVNNYPLIPNKELLNIIDVEGDGLNDIESLKYEITKKNTKKTIPTKVFNVVTPQALCRFDFGAVETVTSYSIEIFACNTKEDSPVVYYGPAIELRCIKEDESYTVLDSIGEGTDYSKTKLSGTCEESCRYVEVVLNSKIKQSGMYAKNNGVKAERTSNVTYEKITKKAKTDFALSNYVDITNKYINSFNRLKANSLWLIDNNYRAELEEYIRKLS